MDLAETLHIGLLVGTCRFFLFFYCPSFGRCHDNGKKSNQESGFDFETSRQCPVKWARDTKRKPPAPTYNPNYDAYANPLFSLSRYLPISIFPVKVTAFFYLWTPTRVNYV